MLAVLDLIFIVAGGGRACASATGGGVSSVAGRRRHSGGGNGNGKEGKELCDYRMGISESVPRTIVETF